MSNSNQNSTLEILLKSLADDFNATERDKIFEALKKEEPTDDALLGAKIFLEANDWDYNALKKALGTTENKIDTIVLDHKKRRNIKKNYHKYAAVLIPFVAIFGYFALNNSNSIDVFYTKDTGLPNLMSNSSQNEWNQLMFDYKTDKLEKAYELAVAISERKVQNDTASYFKGVVAYDLKKYEIANQEFKKVALNSKSAFLYDAEYRLGFSLFQLDKKEAAKLQFKKIEANFESPYNSEATTILKELF